MKKSLFTLLLFGLVLCFPMVAKAKTVSLTVGKTLTIKNVKKVSSSDSSVISVKKGKLTAKKHGVATVNVKYKKGKKASIKVYVSSVPGLYDETGLVKTWKELLKQKSIELAFSDKEILRTSGLSGTLVIPEGITNIDRGAFIDSEIKNILYPRSLTWIDSYAFNNSSLVSFLPDTVSKVSFLNEGAFMDCEDLSDINIGSASVTLSDVFKNSGLKSFSTNKEVNLSAFSDSKIESFNIGKAVKKINGHFIGNENLVKIAIDPKNDVYTDLGVNAVVKKADNTLIAGCKSTSFSDGIKIADYAFKGSVTPDSMVIPSLSIGYEAFMNSSAKEIVLESTTFIGSRAFANCKLSKLELPDTLKSCGEEAFIYLQELPKLYIPSGVKGSFLFQNVWPKKLFFADSEDVVHSNILEAIWSNDIKYGVTREECEKA